MAAKGWPCRVYVACRQWGGEHGSLSIMKTKFDKCWDWCRKHVQFVAAAISAPFLVLAFYLIIADRVGAATLSAAVFLVLVLLPSVESIKAFGLFEAKLRKATELLEKLSAVAKATGDLTYAELGQGSRVGGTSTKENQKLADAADKMMRDLGISEDEIRLKKKYYIEFAVYDIYDRFDGVFVDYANSLNHKNLKKLSELPPEQSNSDAANVLRDTSTKLMARRRVSNRIEDLREFGFRELCDRNIDDDIIPDGDAKLLRKYADRLNEIVSEVENSGRITDRAAELIDARTQEDRKRRYRMIFNEDPI